MDSRLVGCWKVENWKDHSQVSFLHFEEAGIARAFILVPGVQGPDYWVCSPHTIWQDNEFEYLVRLEKYSQSTRIWFRFLNDKEILFHHLIENRPILFQGWKVSPAECPKRLQDEIGF